ncbi:MAG: DUF2785 domain-containing protein [Clostridiales bacterium]|jgi:hypothetical protein|nr:DUF2785 domain-containing protein [Clostridiales bacterium]
MDIVKLKGILTDFAGSDLRAKSEAEIKTATNQMLQNFDVADSQLRDELIYPIFTKLIDENILSEDDYVRILDICLDEEHLFYRLGEVCDGVFVRSLSALIISSILHANVKRNFLIPVVMDAILDKSLEYIDKEIDGRDYVEDMGWAHAIAHGADILQALALNPQVPAARYSDILAAVESCLFKDASYFDLEGERLAGVIMAMLNRGMGSDVFHAWIAKIIGRLAEVYAAEGFTYKYHRNNVNITNFLKSLYFGLKKDGERTKLRVDIFQIIRNFY